MQGTVLNITGYIFSMLEKYTTIIWDWNGTLLNDVDICIGSMNKLLTERKLPLLDTEKYRQIFTFPVRDYYEKAGVDFSKEAFETPAMQFINNYRLSLPGAALQQGAKEALSFFRDKKKEQSVLSVMEQQLLISSVKGFGIDSYFDRISGIDNHYGEGKTELALRTLKEIRELKEKILLVGDTLHDHEVASATGIDCILIAHGHQSHERLGASGRVIVNNFDELLSLF
jgi:phosphoglycolate phosphatase